MRIRVLAFAGAVAIALATPAFAQMGGYPGPQSYMDGRQASSQYNLNDHALPQAYVKKVTALSYRTLELRAEDGGTLTPEHLTTLQRELDGLKREYHVVAGLRIAAK